MGRLDLLTRHSASSLHRNIRVCSDHFEEEYFTSTLRTRLHRGAEPVPIRTAEAETTAEITTQDYQVDFPPEENAESQGQSSDKHAKEQCWSVNSHESASSRSTTLPSSNMEKSKTSESSRITRDIHTQKTMGSSQSIVDFDAVDYLFLSWAKTVKTFSPQRLLQTKRAITNIILKREKELFIPEGTIEVKEMFL